jgi:hypothetical protein
MFAGIVKCQRPIILRSTPSNIARDQQRSAHESMPDHERDGRLPLLGESEKLRSKIATDIAVEGHVIGDPETVEDREKQQRVFRALPQRFRLFDEQLRARRPPWCPAQRSP